VVPVSLALTADLYAEPTALGPEAARAELRTTSVSRALVAGSIQVHRLLLVAIVGC